MTKRLIEAAKAASSKMERSGSASLLIAKVQLDAAISDAERQAADDAQLITREWFVSMSADKLPMIEITGGVIISMIKSDVYINVSALPHIKNRGQLRKLIAALKGGE